MTFQEAILLILLFKNGLNYYCYSRRNLRTGNIQYLVNAPFPHRLKAKTVFSLFASYMCLDPSNLKIFAINFRKNVGIVISRTPM